MRDKAISLWHIEGELWRKEGNIMSINIKKLVAFLLAFIILFPLCMPVSASKVTALDLTNRNIIESASLPVSALYTRSGKYTMELSGKNLNKNFAFKPRKDWSNYDVMSMWVYSPVGITTPITFMLVSDNPETQGKDYFYTTAELGSLGWNYISLPYSGEDSVFYKNGNPVGLSDIDEFKIVTSFDGEKAKKEACLYFDKIILEKWNSEVSQNYVPQTIVSASGGNKEQVDAELFGDFTMGKSGIMLGEPPVTDWTEYNTLVIKMKNDYWSERYYNIWIMSEDPNNNSWDYWPVQIDSKWTGEKELVIDKSEGIGGIGSGKPLGWDQITEIRIYPQGEPDDKAAIYVESMYLTNRDYKTQLFSENSRNYVVDAQPEENFYDYAADLRAKNVSHPRLLLGADYMETLKGLVKTDTYLNKTLSQVKRVVDGYVAKGPMEKVIDSGTSLRLIEGAILYNITEEKKYADWIWESVYNMTAGETSWIKTTNTYLAVGDTLQAMALCYDWMYNHWTEEQRMIVRNGMMHYGIEYVLRQNRTYSGWGGSNKGNTTQTMLTGLGLAAIAIFDEPEYDELVNEILNRVMVAFNRVMPGIIDENGAYCEGISYWLYGMGTYYLFADAMWEVLGSDAAMDFPGMEKSGMYPIAITGPGGSYNYGDANVRDYVSSATFFFLSRYYNNPVYGAYEISNTGTTGTSSGLTLAMYRPDKRYEEDFSSNMPKYVYYPGEDEVLTIRKNWTDNNATFLGVKAGQSKPAFHVQLDIGTYCFDMLGERWAHELGTDTYNQGSKYEDGVFAFYRNRIEGQNGLLINPDGKVDQNTDVNCKIDEYKVTDNAAYALMDISEAYEGRGIDSVKRGFALLNNFGSLLIQDEIKSAAPVEAYTFMHTKADIEIAEDGKSAILTQNGKKLRARLLSPANGVLLDMAAEPLEKSPHPVEAKNNDAFRKLAAYVTETKNPTISMLLTPYQEDEECEFMIDDVKPLRMFKNYLKNTVSVEQIYLDGIPINNFNRDVSSYTLNEYRVGNITAEASSDTIISVKQAENVGDTAFVIAESSKTGDKAVYTISFSDDIHSMMEVSTYIPKKVITSTEGNLITEITDGDTTTAWGKGEPDWVGFDLGTEKEIREMKVMWSQGSARYAYFTIDVSNDAVNWETVYDGKSFMTDDFETYSFNPVQARYIRLYGTGNSVNTWTTILEMRVTAYEDAFNDISNHSAKEDIQHLANLGFVTNEEGDSFNPDSELSRGEFIKLIQKVTGISDMAYSGNIVDVARENKYSSAIEGAYAFGIIPNEMLIDGNFLPEAPITCEEVIAISVRLCNKLKNLEENYVELENYKYSNEISSWCVPYMRNAVALRLLDAKLTDNGFIPNQNATKAHCAVVAKNIFIKTN